MPPLGRWWAAYLSSLEMSEPSPQHRKSEPKHEVDDELERPRIQDVDTLHTLLEDLISRK